MRRICIFVGILGCAAIGCGKQPGQIVDGGHDAALTTDPSRDATTVDVSTDASTATTAISAANVEAFSASPNAYTTVPYNNLAYDDLGEFDVATSTFTARHADDYLVCASLDIGLASAEFYLVLFKNGLADHEFGVFRRVASGCAPVRLVAGDTMAVRMYRYSGADIAVQPNAFSSWLTIERQPSTLSVAFSLTDFISLPNATFVKVPYSTVEHDDASQFDVNNHEFVAATPGDDQVCASSRTQLVGAELDVFINDNRAVAVASGNLHGCRSVRLAAGDAVSIWMYDSTGNALVASGSDLADWFTIAPQQIASSTEGIDTFSPLANTFVKVPYASATIDALHEFDGGSHSFTAATAGDYQLCASLALGAVVSGDEELDLYKNGAREKALQNTSDAGTLSGCRIVRLAAHDELQVYYYSTVASTIATDPYWDWFEVSKLK